MLFDPFHHCRKASLESKHVFHHRYLGTGLDRSVRFKLPGLTKSTSLPSHFRRVFLDPSECLEQLSSIVIVKKGTMILEK